MSEPPRPPDDWEDDRTERLPASEEPTRQLPARPVAPPPEPPQPPEPARGRAPEPPPSKSGWRKAAPWLVALLVLLVLGGGVAAYLLLRDDGGGETETSSVPGVVRLPEEQAVQALEESGFRSRVVSAPSDAAQEGIVYAQNPTAGVQLEEGAAVTISVSSGPKTATVPSVVGLSQDAAVERLEAAGLTANAFQVFSQEPEGVVVAQNPQGGGSASVGSAVRINVSKGTGVVVVPEVVGQDIGDATSALEGAGLEANPVDVPSQEAQGTVVAQNPPGGAQTQRGSMVRVNVSLGPP